jgi:hypothetical protein
MPVAGILASLGVVAVSLATVLTYALALAALAAIVAAFLAIRASGTKRPARRTAPVTRRRSTPEAALANAASNGRSIAPGQAGAVLRERGGEGREFRLGEEPAVIGASDSVSTIILDGDGIAPEHARIWLRQHKYLLHHVGGLSRKTYVSGQEADWVVLETGDEVAIGAHRLVFEDLRLSQRELPPAPVEQVVGRREQSSDDDLSRMEAAVRELWADALPASETAVGERSGTGKYKVHRRKDELAQRVGGKWVKRGRTVVLER